MPRMVVNLCDRFDQRRYSGQRPQIRCIALRSLKELLPNLLDLLVAEPPWATCSRGALDRLRVSVEPASVPTADALTTYSQGCCHCGLSVSVAEHRHSFFSTSSEHLKPFDSPLHQRSISRKEISVTYLYEIQ